MSIIEQLIKIKHSHAVELEIHLFENCNMTCAFCCQDHGDSGFTEEDVKIKLSLAEKFLKDKAKVFDNFYINIMGGEIYQDKFISNFPRYEEIYETLNSYLPDKEIRFSTATNLMIDDIDKLREYVLRLKSRYDFRFNVSYDIFGRYKNDDQKNHFKSNVEKIKELIDTVAITLHKPSIEKLLERSDDYFDYLYNNFHVNFTWYVPDKKLPQFFMPSDDNCRDILKFLAKNYPNTTPIKNYLQNEVNNIQCCSENRMLIDASNNYSNCQYLPYQQKDFKTKLDRYSTKNLLESFVKEHKCISCEFFNRCGFYCYVANDSVHRKANDICFIKEFFEELKQ